MDWLSFCYSVLTKEPEMLQTNAFCKHKNDTVQLQQK